VVRGSVCDRDHVGYNSGTVLVYSYALTGPTALYAPEDVTNVPEGSKGTSPQGEAG
jgi:hypothetical protein